MLSIDELSWFANSVAVAFSDNFDNKDPEWRTLYDEFLRVIDNQECLNLNYNKLLFINKINF